MSINVKANLKNHLLKNFDNNNIKYIYGYGSGIFPQKDNKPKMIDLIFIVENTADFHNNNLIRNKNHYSKLAIYAKPLLNYFNENGTLIYYNPSILIDNNMNIKYGIISRKNFIKILKEWNNLFVSGRFHKPVLCVYDSNEENSPVNKGI